MTPASLWQRLLGRGSDEESGGQESMPAAAGDAHARGAGEALRALLEDPDIPPQVRAELAADFARVEAMLEKIERGELHVAVFGRVSAGKSALANALLGHEAFAVGVLHGTTTEAAWGTLQHADGSGLSLIDTPGINELEGEAREQLAFEVAQVSDLVIFVADGDLTRQELDALRTLAATQRPLLLALNKADRYGEEELERLLAHLRQRVAGLVHAEDVLACAARPAVHRSVQESATGESSRDIEMAPDIAALRQRLLAISEREGKTLAALNASLFAGRLSDQVGTRIAQARCELAARVIRQYCIAKAVAVALNPVPVADLLAAGALDATMVAHLARVYGLPMARAEAGRLVITICAQLAALMGAVWGVHLVASALKAGSAGLSTVLTAGAQGALAWYATVLVGRAAERYLVNGKSWGDKGPKKAVKEIVASLDRDSILREAREEILKRLKDNKARA